MENLTPNQPERKQVTRVVQIALATNATNALNYVPSRLLNDLPEHLEGVDVIELRLLINRDTKGIVSLWESGKQ